MRSCGAATRCPRRSWTARMPWAARFGASLALVSLLELLLAEVLPAAGRTIDLFVLLVILSSLGGNSLQGVTGGLAAGVVQDTLSASPFGLHALACCVVGYGVARLSQRIVTSQRLVASLLVAVGTLVHQAIVLGLLMVLEVGEPSGGAVPLRVVATTAIGVPGLWLFNRAQAWADERRTLKEGRARLR
ncbi:MAG: rod shape-determining protein MreD [Holophagales bacterium]|nr:rod shape-determining protein MreD [Holophagales bacterium]MYC11023.1 rod shape-determining protein MreD [Holophagales bacterium]